VSTGPGRCDGRGPGWGQGRAAGVRTPRPANRGGGTPGLGPRVARRLERLTAEFGGVAAAGLLGFDDQFDAERLLPLKVLNHGPLRLDRALPVQYLYFLGNLFRGDLGTSLWQHESALKVVMGRAPATLLLAATAIAIVIAVGLAVGVVAAVVPWNFPLLMASWKIGPTLATGNSMILKPAEQSPLTAIRVPELALEAGLPEGVLNVVPGFGETAGQGIGRDILQLVLDGHTEGLDDGLHES